jgi:hypothetical protein
VRRKSARRDLADIREYVASEHEDCILRYAVACGDEIQAARSRGWVAACRAGEAVVIRWYELPEGTLPLPPLARGGPNECVVLTRDGRIVPEDVYLEEKAAAG